MTRTLFVTLSAVPLAASLAVSSPAYAQTSVRVGNAATLKAEIDKANLRPVGTDNFIYLDPGTYLMDGIPHIKRTIRLIGANAATTVISGAKSCTKRNKDRLPARLEYLFGDESGTMNKRLLFDKEMKYEVCVPAGQTLSVFNPVIHSLFYVDGGGLLWLQGVTVRDGMSTRIGGGAIHNEGTLVVQVSTIAHNHSSWGGGGGIYNAGTAYVYDSTIRQNFAHASEGGGIFNDAGGYLEISHSTVSGNAGACAGGIYNGDTVRKGDIGGPMYITNSTISNNKAVQLKDAHSAECEKSAGGILHFGSFDSWLKNVTVTENLDFTGRPLATGGIAASRRGGSTPLGGINPLNTLVVNNRKAAELYWSSILGRPVVAGTLSECYDTIYTAGGNLVGTTASSRASCSLVALMYPYKADVIVSTAADPGLDTELIDNGGNTCTHALKSGSLAVNRGWPKGSTGQFALDEYDQRWVKRQDQSDIGSYSFTQSSGNRLGLQCTSW